MSGSSCSVLSCHRLRSGSTLSCTIVRQTWGMLARTVLVISFLVLPKCAVAQDADAQNRDVLEQKKSLGPVSVTTRLFPKSPRIGDLVTLELEVISEDQVEVLMPEFGDVISGFAISQYIPKQKITPDGKMRQSITYQFQVAYSGKQAIQPIGIEFVDNRPGQKSTPDDYDAFEIETDRISFTVASVLLKGASADLKPPRSELTPMQDSSKSYLWVLVAGVIMGVFVVAILTIFLLGKRETVRKANAYEIARRRLDKLLSDRSSGNPTLTIDSFFVEISSVIRKYLEDRFSLRAPELTTDEFLIEASGKGVLTEQHQSLLREFLTQADLVKFAGVSAGDAEVRRSIDLAQRFLEETRLNAPQVEIREDIEIRADESVSFQTEKGAQHVES